MIDFNYNNKYKNKIVTPEKMISVRKMLDTSVLHGPIIEFDDLYTDCPSVFRYNDKWYMYFIAISKDVRISGYETHLATSPDLLNWTYVGPILTRDETRIWDSKQIAGYASLYNPNIGSGCKLENYDNKYWITYLAGASDGYEPDPLLMGISSTTSPIDKSSFTRLDNPILTPNDSDVRFYETKTLYKSTVIRDEDNLTNHKFVMFYNAKGYDNCERIYSAVSNDMIHWERYGDCPVIDNSTGNPDCRITADPMILRDSDGLYIMNFMEYSKSKSAFDTFACSYDLINWSIWRGEPTISPDKNNKNQDLFAHKPWIITWEGHTYHFYCACTSDKRRYISLATDF